MNNNINNSTKITTFCCNWSVHPGLRLSESVFPEEDSIIISMCTGRVDTELILQAFNSGAWGVLICACPLGECEHDGNYKTLRRVLLMKNIMKQLNIEPERIKIEWVNTGEIMKVTNAVKSFSEEIMNLGPIK